MNQEQLRLFANLFVSRRDDYALQQADGRYLRAGRPLTYSTTLTLSKPCYRYGAFLPALRICGLTRCRSKEPCHNEII